MLGLSVLLKKKCYKCIYKWVYLPSQITNSAATNMYLCNNMFKQKHDLSAVTE